MTTMRVVVEIHSKIETYCMQFAEDGIVVVILCQPDDVILGCMY